MPNWCANTLSISSSDAETIAAFKEQARAEGTDLSFQKFLPVPESLLTTPHCVPPVNPKERKELDHVWASNVGEYGSADAYEWRIKRWGTNWDVSAKLVKARPHYLEYAFDSVSSPPLAWLRHVSACFAGVVFFLNFSSPDMPFASHATAVAGVVDVQTIETEMNW